MAGGDGIVRVRLGDDGNGDEMRGGAGVDSYGRLEMDRIGVAGMERLGNERTALDGSGIAGSEWKSVVDISVVVKALAWQEWINFKL